MGAFNRTSEQKRQHRERAQPFHRQRYGLLEKKKDYVLRARDYADKQRRLRALRGKAATKNEDAFDFRMIKARTRNGIETRDRGNTALTQEQAKVLKSQDAKYINMVASVEKKKMEKQRDHIQPATRSRVVYEAVDDDTPGDAVPAATAGQPVQVSSVEAKAKAARARESAARAARLERIELLAKESQLQKNLAGKGARVRVGTDQQGTPKYKWKSERKR